MINIGILGGGPAALFLMKHLIHINDTHISITIIEKTNQLGAGMPYSTQGACTEHVTNVSDNEIPELVTPIHDWIMEAPEQLLRQYNINEHNFNEYKVLPRLFFGQYLSAQFDKLLTQAKENGIAVQVLYNTTALNIFDDTVSGKVKVETSKKELAFDRVIICTGHNWPTRYEGEVTGWFDSPYPPSKLQGLNNYSVAVRGASLSAIDVIKTLARNNGAFSKNENGKLLYHLNEGSENFKIVLHSLYGLMPAVRFHLDDTHLSPEEALTFEEIQQLRNENDGYVPLDYLFEQKFKAPLKISSPDFYEKIRHMNMEAFVQHMLALRERLDAFQLLKAEYTEAEKSIKRKASVFWKEQLGSLSYIINYPAKHFCAEDMLRHKKILMPLISIIIAYIPQSSCNELLALYDAGILSLTAVDPSSNVVPGPDGGAEYTHTDDEGIKHINHYNLFVDAIGQPAFDYGNFIFGGLIDSGTISPARLKFKDAKAGEAEKEKANDKVERTDADTYYLKVPGISINDHFQVMDRYGVYSERTYIMAVPYIAGLNPDFSGLDFCEAASAAIVKSLLPRFAARQD